MSSSRLTLILKVIAGVLAGLLVVLLAASIYLYRLSETLPDISADARMISTPRTSFVYAADGSEIATWHGEQDRTIVLYDDIPQSLVDAVVAIEDERFYTHNGVDLEAIVRALKVNAEAGTYAQGGSTITQQVVKLLFTDGKRTMTRKIREALLAFQLETKADKQEVLETYLNLVYFGDGAYGVESAAQHYFGKSVSALTLADSATLAAVIRSPGRYSPVDDPEATQERRDLVLAKMRELGYITADERRLAQAEELVTAPSGEPSESAPYFVEYVKQVLIDRLGSEMVFQGGLRVYTTLDPAVQQKAESAADAILGNSDDPSVALVCINHRNGDILAMVGGRDFTEDKFNLATQGRRQPGSAFKPFVLVTALENGIKPGDVFSAAPYTVQVKDGTWNVQNYENTITGGSLTLSAATNWSVNAVYARLIIRLGPEKVVETAKAMGITSSLEPNPAIALGGLTTGVSPLEMASAYGTIANDGVHAEPSAIIRVTGDDGALVFEPERAVERAVPEDVARTASLMLHDVMETGTGQAARIPAWSAGKTGTTQGYRDAWFVGYSGDMVTAVWVGHPEGQIPMTNVRGIRVTGGSFPAMIWKRFMEQALVQTSAPEPLPGVGGEVAHDVVMVHVCADTFLLANPRCPNAVDVYLDPKDVPTKTCGVH
ncbi:MAG: PBP1A family penicillin-binding protein [Coriobacteriia bacterium]|nr:PBP1A family penicillin-binding protein [Coriobacteriia bacterium]